VKDEIKDKWIAALESGQYKQATEALNINNEKFCCLGVLCELAHQEGVVSKNPPLHDCTAYRYGDRDESGYLPYEVIAWSGLDSHNPTVDGENLTRLNDKGVPFDQLAILIKEHL